LIYKYRICFRGLVSINALRRIENLVGKPIHTMFDYMCGVSTGAVITAMLGKLIT
jgi:calcium-independent phospholipase A2-gamma